MDSPAPDAARAPSARERARKRALGQALQADMSRLLLWHPFTAGLALHLQIVPLRDWRVPTAATDGRHIYFDIDFADTLSTQERLFVLAHEVWHNAMEHAHRRGPREPKLWGLAADAEINALLQEDGLQAPTHAVRFDTMRGCSAEQIYAWLRDGPKARWAAMHSFDVHDLPAGATPPGEMAVEDPDFAPARSTEADLRRQWRERRARAGRLAAVRGTLPAGLACAAGAVGEPRVPWPQVLRQFLHGNRGGAWSRLRPSRRHAWRGAWLPSRGEGTLRLVVGLDTSGSTEGLQGRFLGELHGIAQAFGRYELLVLECDAQVQRETLVTEADGPGWMDRFKRDGLVGGGGTDFRPIFERASRQQTQALLLFTDGCGLAPEQEPPWPVIWALAGAEAQAPVPWGARLEVGGE